jgi:hypothetical protein
MAVRELSLKGDGSAEFEVVLSFEFSGRNEDS